MSEPRLTGDAPVPWLGRHARALWAVGFLAAFSVLFYWSAYVCDDAWISLRVVENAVRGHGLRFNGIERVQVYTSPLFTLLLVPVYWLVDGPAGLPHPTRLYFTVLGVSYLLSLATVLRISLAPSLPAALLAFALLASSQAFMTFTSSGLETPLLFLLVTLFYVDYLRDEPGTVERGFLLMLYAALAVLTRFDAALLLIAPALHVAWRLVRRFHWRGAGAAVLAAVPLLGWFTFALVYYGSIFPTPYYAKVMARVDPAIIREMGGAYLALIAYLDPITLLFTAFAALLAFLGLRPALAMVSALAYLAYVYLVGGDFIGWRFAAPPFLISVLVAQRSFERLLLPRVGWLAAAAGVVALLLYGVAVPSTPLRASRDLPTQHNVQFYYDSARLARWRPGLSFPFADQHGVRSEGHCRSMRRNPRAVFVRGAGISGYCSGPTSYVIAPSGVTDALLSRLSVQIDQPFKPGHAWRPVPAGYEKSARLQRNEIADPELARYYDKVLLLNRGPLLQGERWRAIWELNFTDQRRYPGTHVDGRPIRFAGSARALRTSPPGELRELRAIRELPEVAPEPAPLRAHAYDCAGVSIVVHQEESQIVLLREGETLRLPRQPSESGTRFADDSVRFESDADGVAHLQVAGEEPRRCREQPAQSRSEDARLRGVHLRGRGRAPAWRLEVGPDWILFEHAARELFTLFDPFVERGRYLIYEGRNRTREIRIAIEDRACRDVLTGEVFPATIDIYLEGQRFHGCGRRLRPRVGTGTEAPDPVR